MQNSSIIVPFPICAFAAILAVVSIMLFVFVLQSTKIRIQKDKCKLSFSSLLFLDYQGKTYDQITDMSDSYILADGIETPYRCKLPIWIVGFLYQRGTCRKYSFLIMFVGLYRQIQSNLPNRTSIFQKNCRFHSAISLEPYH